MQKGFIPVCHNVCLAFWCCSSLVKGFSCIASELCWHWADQELFVGQAALASTADVPANKEQEIPEGGYTNKVVLPALPSLDPGEPAPKLPGHFVHRHVGRVFLCKHFEDPESLVCLLAKSNVGCFFHTDTDTHTHILSFPASEIFCLGIHFLSKP